MNQPATLARVYLVITIGTLLSSLSYALFFVPAHIPAGGVSGIAVILNYRFGWPTGLLVFLFNVPLLIAGYIYLGGARFIARTLFSVALFSATVDPLGHLIHPLTHDAFLATLYGGSLSGLGVGLIFGQNASSGGTTILSRLLRLVSGLSSGIAQLVVDALVVSLAAVVVSPQSALYGLISLFVSGKAIDWTLEGISGERVALIISPAAERISDRITHDLHRGTTLLTGRGGYTGETRPVLLCVVDRAQEPELRALIIAEDPHAFLTVTAATTVLGEGFEPLRAPAASRSPLRWLR